MSGPRVVVVGSSNTDMVVKAERIPRVGETISGGQFVMAAGGKGANQAVAAARMGAEVTFVAKLGDDLFGQQAVANYQEEGIITDLILRDPEHHTGVALIIVDAQGENLIAVAPGANHALRAKDLDRAAERIRSADVLMLQLEIPLETVRVAIDIAAESGVPVILDPAPAAPLDRSLLAKVDYLTPNESEAERLTGVAVKDETSAQAAARKLLEAGAKHVIVTLGAQGALVATREQTVLVPSCRVEAKDSTAAGDAFNGALAAALGEGVELPAAVRRACMAGALSATRMGAQPSLPTREQLDRFLAANPAD